MEFNEFEVNSDDLHERLSSWRRGAGMVGQLPASIGDISINEAEVRQRQQRAASMIFTSVRGHDAFVAELKALVENHQQRDLHHQQRVEDFAAFVLGVFEQFSAGNLHKGLTNEADGFPKEIIETVTIPAPQPPRSWLQRALGI